jgi:glutaredoxin
LIVKFLTRDGCHLCDDARPLVERAAGRAGVDVEEIDVDSNEELRQAYGASVPVVVASGGEVLAEGLIDDERALRRAMRRSARSSR